MSKYSAMDIAKWFLTYAQGNPDANDITQLKLQKLLYYAYGTYYALTDKKLFDDPIIAWKHGPIVKDVYNSFREFEGKPIELNEIFSCDKFSAEDTDILTSVYDRFGQYSAWKLSDMTHQEAPWKDTAMNCMIDPESIKDYFEKNYIDMEAIDYINSREDLSRSYSSVDELMESLYA